MSQVKRGQQGFRVYCYQVHAEGGVGGGGKT